ncbi:MAG: menaquinone-dependent protoporphyrinogen IX dehydrogenase [Gammaproteobacteria bacterium]|nr:menaquinone-dependent protoporphyrinogen IX dehydrogenase [Gammaproteobacteria bacterium]MDH4310838.1 menaquinone-dependent protoporphyrinogen IX dehydrogenase [Gammaproteobacteria bacterium]MDH5272011.1 menaquinone-dependent protoporphyrinogen IX dehydrogenase [Gammaproteobacteria bacterium]
MARILFLYHGVYGHTLKVSGVMRDELVRLGHTAEVRPLVDGPRDAATFDAIVIGASIRHGKHNPAVYAFIEEHRALLDAKPNAFFSISLVARKPRKNTPETNPYMQKFLALTTWRPQLLAVFGGVLDYQRYGPFDRHAIRFIMRLTGGPTDLHTNVEFTPWDEVRRFAGRIAALAEGRVPG